MPRDFKKLSPRAGPMAPWIMLCLELIIDYIILVFSPHSFPHSLYLYSFFASEKKKNKKFHFCTMGVLYFILKQNHLFFFPSFFSPFLHANSRSSQKKKKEKSFTSFIAMSSQDSFYSAHYFHRSRVSTVCKCCRSVRCAEEQKDLVGR